MNVCSCIEVVDGIFVRFEGCLMDVLDVKK
jgi:hypothetical protein